MRRSARYREVHAHSGWHAVWWRGWALRARGPRGRGREAMGTARTNDISYDHDERTPLVPKMMGGIRQVDEKLVDLVRERPVAAVCTALAVGYLIGRMFASRG